MTIDEIRTDRGNRAPCLDLNVLLAAAQTSEAALHAFYVATAPRLAFALTAATDQRLAEDVLVRTYQQVWHHPTTELSGFADDLAVLNWLTRIALVELASERRAAVSQVSRGT